MSKTKKCYTLTNQNILDLGFVNPILCLMYETPFPVTPRELLKSENFQFENVLESTTVLFYMEEKGYVKNIGTERKPFFEITPIGVSLVESILGSETIDSTKIEE